MLYVSSNDLGPMPDSCSSWAECSDPAATITSLVAYAVCRGADAFGANYSDQSSVDGT